MSEGAVAPTMATILVHGGAGPVRDGRHERRKEGCRRAAQAGQEALEATGDPVRAVEAAVVVLEDDPVFNAGTGSYLAADGQVYVDAAVAEGRDLRAGAVAHLRGVANPVRLARRILEEDLPHVFYVAEGARGLAERWDLAVDPRDLVTDEKQKLWDQDGPVEGADTVGAIACLDGHLACAQSTGGTPGKAPGRIGDAPLLGAGLYADDEVGAAMCTGDGEALMRILSARRVLKHLTDGPEQACRQAIDILEQRVDATGGVLAVAPDGRVGHVHNTPHMAWAAAVDGDLEAGI